jgi:type II secretory pathway pseudopilin PulG
MSYSGRVPVFTGRVRFQKGITLLEMMLVISIIGFLIIASVKMYQQLQNMLALKQIQENVDQLFEAAANYYQATCDPVTPAARYQTPITGAPPTAPFNISITGELLAKGFLENWRPNNPLVNPAGGESGYLVQFNPSTSTTPIPVTVCSGPTVGSPQPSKPPYPCLAITSTNLLQPTRAYSGTPSAQIPTAQAKVVTIVIQVSVFIRPQSKIGGYGAILGATCISGLTGSTVDPCSAPNPSRTYLVWARIPSAISIKRGSLFASFRPLVKEFQLQYTHDQNFELNSGYSTSSSSSAPLQAPVYYLCGG